MLVEMLFVFCFFIALLSKIGALPSSGRSFSREPVGQTAPESCRKPAGSPREIGVSGRRKT